MERKGYNGRILHIDLTTRCVAAEEPDERFWRLYAGGGLLATWYLMKRCPPGIDAFDPANLLILASSVVAGHPYAGLARFTAAAKSPLTGGIGETRGEGPFGMALKASGYDAIVISGASDVPIAMFVEDGIVSFHDAEKSWGQPVSATVDRLEAVHGKGIASAVIGPAGESLVRYASIVTNRTHQAPRMGMGAVMGSKRLKAIVLRGGRLPPVADPAACQALGESYRVRMTENPLTRWQLDPPGFSAWIHIGNDATLCTRNYRDGTFEAASAYEPAKFMDRYRGVAPCPGCPNDCIKLFAGDPAVPNPDGAGGIHQEITGTLGPNLGIGELDDVLEANILCNEYGLDPTSLGFTLSMAMECVARGIIAEAEAEGLRFGNGGAMRTMIPRIAHRQGFGDVLAEGARRAAERIAPEAEPFALHVKGQEMTCFEPRTQTNLGLGYAVAPIGPRYDICEHDWDYDLRVGWPHTLDSSRTLGILDRIPMDHVGVDKVRNFKALNTLWSAADALDLCIFAIAPTRVFTLEEMTQLLAAVTGWTTSSFEVMRYGERRNHLMRAYNLREGLGAADDRLPDRFFDEPINAGPWIGARLDRDKFAAAIAAYYRMMGWDESGRPLYETLVDHHLEWVMDEGHLART
jgi:aldehyde:ferredoxin oxidoreductase